MHQNNEKEAKHEYKLAVKGVLSTHWIATNDQGFETHLNFSPLGPCVITNSQNEPIGKISREKLLSTKKLITLNTNNSRLKVHWSRKADKFNLIGESNIQGYEQINWKWKQGSFESKLVLMVDGDKQRVIAEFKRSNWKLKKLGKLVIFEDLHNDINLFIACSVAYSVSHLREEEALESIVY
jgi:hypothetical protein